MAQSERAGGITVTGVGVVWTRPDMCVVRVGAHVIDATVVGATTTANEVTSRLVAAARRHGVGDDELQTGRLAVSPEYDHGGRRPKLVGHRASSSVVVRLRDVDGAGAVLDELVAAGGEHVVVQGVGFELADDSAALVEARAEAWTDALARASQLADLAGLALGRAESIVEGSTDDGTLVLADRAFDSRPAAGAVIEPGAVETAVSIRVRFAVDGDDRPGGWGFVAGRSSS